MWVDHHLIVVPRRRWNRLLLLLLMWTEVAEIRLLLLLLLLMVRLWRWRRMVMLLLLVMVVTGGRHLLLLLMVIGHINHVGGTGRFDETVGHRGLELARGVHDRRMPVHGHLAHATATAAASADQAATTGRLGPAVAVHGGLVVIIVVARRGRCGRLPDFHPVVGRETRVRHSLWRLPAYGGPDVVVWWYALPGGRVTGRIVHVMLLAVMMVVHDHAAADDASTAADVADASADDASTTADDAAAVPHIGRHVRVGKVRAHVQQVTAIALHFVGR